MLVAYWPFHPPQEQEVGGGHKAIHDDATAAKAGRARLSMIDSNKHLCRTLGQQGHLRHGHPPILTALCWSFDDVPRDLLVSANAAMIVNDCLVNSW